MLEAVNPRSPAGLDRAGPPFDLALDERGEILLRGACSGLAPSFIDNPVQAIARADFLATSCAMRALQ